MITLQYRQQCLSEDKMGGKFNPPSQRLAQCVWNSYSKVSRNIVPYSNGTLAATNEACVRVPVTLTETHSVINYLFPSYIFFSQNSTVFCFDMFAGTALYALAGTCTHFAWNAVEGEIKTAIVCEHQTCVRSLCGKKLLR